MIKSQTKDKIIGQYILHIAAVKPDKRHRDLDNLLKATCDLLVKTNIVESDSMCRALAAEWVEFGAPMTLTIYGLEEEIEEWKIPKHMVN
jgi:Holliday junction resolvase RusA-like endonuclease